MPLPDERPRQSVANLIGRFEQQTKRQSLVGTPSRTSSALANPSGDASKIEVKEKREWPPKPKQDVETEAKPAAPTAPVPENVPLKPSLPTPDASPKVEVAQLPEAVSALNPEDSPIADADSIPSPIEPAQTTSSSPTLKPATVRQSGVGSTTTAPSKSQATPSKAKTPSARPVTSKPPVPRTPARSPPTSFHTPPAISASTSAPSGIKGSPASKLTHSQSQAQVRPRPVSSASVRAPTTPSRSKTPSTARPKTPSARPKTPSASTTSAKTRPSLFAPTAASLARTRGADDGPALPLKKLTLAPDAAERLSKPTAASLQKTRAAAGAPTSPTPVRTVTPVKRGAASMRGAASTRGASTKARGGAAVGTKAKVVSGAAEETPFQVLETATSAQAHEGDEEHIEEVVTIDLEETHVDEPVLHDEPEEQHVDAPTHDVEPEEPHIDDPTAAVEPEQKEEPSPENVDLAAPSHAADIVTDEQEQEHEVELPGSPSSVKHGDDLADLVSMLEAKKPLADEDVDVVAGEIPDDE
ncbi:hypothetical protein BC835DRAFT_830454 [Cytidiella melzeri]|nr:hypothetical protein BC835DRAFT_830454 [Cytidiella melzeri]